MPYTPIPDYQITQTGKTTITIPRLYGTFYPTSLDLANTLTIDLGAPALADVDAFVVSADMKVGAYTLAITEPADGQARNVTAKRTLVGGLDTPGTALVTGLAVDGRTITETLTPGADGVTVAGTKAFASLVSIVGAGWVVDTGADTIEFGFGDLIGLPSAVLVPPPISGADNIVALLLGTAYVAVTATFDADEIEKCTVNAAAGTYNGTKRLIAFISR